MVRQTKPKPTFEIGQTVYVRITGWLQKGEPKLYEYEVTRFNKTSVYIKPKEFPHHHETRIDIKTMTGSSSIDHYRVYLNPQEFWDKVEQSKRKAELRKVILNEVSSMSLKKLEQLDEFIKKL